MIIRLLLLTSDLLLLLMSIEVVVVMMRMSLVSSPGYPGARWDYLRVLPVVVASLQAGFRLSPE